MARNNIPFEIGAKVAEPHYPLNEYGYLIVGSDGRYVCEYPDKGLVVAGYTYWRNDMSVLTVDPDGNEKEHLHGTGLRLC